MLGKDNYSAADMGTLGNRFITITLYGMLANIGDDISNGYIADASIFKKLVTGVSGKIFHSPLPFQSHHSRVHRYRPHRYEADH